MEKAKVWFGIVVVLGSVVLAAGCSDKPIVYEGEKRPVSEVEEIISDKLEVENPSLDLEVNIVEEQD